MSTLILMLKQKEERKMEEPIPNGVKFESISDADVRKIDIASRTILTQYGMKVTDAESRKIMAEAGCDVDEKTMMVKIPNTLIDKAISSVPARFTMYGRDDKKNVTFESKQRVSGYGTFGCGLSVCHYLGNGKYETVDATAEELGTAARIIDWADNIDLCTTVVLARDWVETGCDDVHQLYQMLINTTKPIVHINPYGTSIEYYWDLIKAANNNDEERARKRPMFAVMSCATTPLEIGENCGQAIIKCARFGIPLVLMTMPIAGASSPAFMAGTVVLNNCEVLGQLVLAQIVNPGLPCWYACSSSIMDMYENTAPMGNPEIALCNSACSRMAALYQIPMWATCMCESKIPDAQAAAEKAYNSMYTSLAGCSIIYGFGSLELGSTFSAEQLVIDNEIIKMEKILVKGIRVDDETLSVDDIIKVGATGDFLAIPKTMEGVGKFSHSNLFDRSLIEAWKSKGSKDVVDRAHEIVEDILENHIIPPYSDKILAQMQEIMDKADQDALKLKGLVN